MYQSVAKPWTGSSSSATWAPIRAPTLTTSAPKTCDRAEAVGAVESAKESTIQLDGKSIDQILRIRLPAFF